MEQLDLFETKITRDDNLLTIMSKILRKNEKLDPPAAPETPRIRGHHKRRWSDALESIYYIPKQINSRYQLYLFYEEEQEEIELQKAQNMIEGKRSDWKSLYKIETLRWDVDKWMT